MWHGTGGGERCASLSGETSPVTAHLCRRLGAHQALLQPRLEGARRRELPLGLRQSLVRLGQPRARLTQRGRGAVALALGELEAAGQAVELHLACHEVLVQRQPEGVLHLRRGRRRCRGAGLRVWGSRRCGRACDAQLRLHLQLPKALAALRVGLDGAIQASKIQARGRGLAVIHKPSHAWAALSASTSRPSHTYLSSAPREAARS